MSKLVRKNLMVDAEEVAALAAARGTSESDAVRFAVSEALAAEETVDALAELHRMSAFADSPHTSMLYGEIPALDPETLRVRHPDGTPKLPRRSSRSARRAT